MASLQIVRCPLPNDVDLIADWEKGGGYVVYLIKNGEIFYRKSYATVPAVLRACARLVEQKEGKALS